MKRLAGVVLVVGLSLADPASAQFYKYLDQQGHIRFTDDINQIPEDQRTKARRYAESQPAAPATLQTDDSTPKKASTAGAAMDAPTPSAFAAPTADEPLDTLRKRVEEMKAHVEAEYQALVKEKEALDKEKGSQKTRDQVATYNQRVEAFNQRAGKYENRTVELRRQVEDYNARAVEGNAKTSGSANK